MLTVESALSASLYSAIGLIGNAPFFSFFNGAAFAGARTVASMLSIRKKKKEAPSKLSDNLESKHQYNEHHLVALAVAIVAGVV